jgi:hypothetical protein
LILTRSILPVSRLLWNFPACLPLGLILTLRWNHHHNHRSSSSLLGSAVTHRLLLLEFGAVPACRPTANIQAGPVSRIDHPHG